MRRKKASGVGGKFFVDQFRATLIENTDVHRFVHVDRCHNNVYGAAGRSSSRGPPSRMVCWDTAILPLHFAAEEAWMSITARHRITARLRI